MDNNIFTSGIIQTIANNNICHVIRFDFYSICKTSVQCYQPRAAIIKKSLTNTFSAQKIMFRMKYFNLFYISYADFELSIYNHYRISKFSEEVILDKTRKLSIIILQ